MVVFPIVTYFKCKNKYISVTNVASNKLQEEAANKKFEERQQAIKPPVQCNTDEDSGRLHEIYKDRVRRTEVFFNYIVVFRLHYSVYLFVGL